MARASSSSKPSKWRRRLVLALRMIGVFAVLGLIALVIAVYVARAHCPASTN